MIEDTMVVHRIGDKFNTIYVAFVTNESFECDRKSAKSLVSTWYTVPIPKEKELSKSILEMGLISLDRVLR